MKRVSSLLRDSVERGRAVDERITSVEKRYSWWSDNPLDWERPVRTLYITGWCVNRCGKSICDIRARIGRRKFLGNYGIQRKDVAAALGTIAVERSGFAIAVPLPIGKSQVLVELREPDGVWPSIVSRGLFGAHDHHAAAAIDPTPCSPDAGAH